MNGKKTSKNIEIIAVYIHLGGDLPKHLILNLKRHRDIFPDQEIVLVSSENWEDKITAGIENLVLSLDELQPSIFKAMSNYHNFDFRNGFWKYTLQRLFALEAIHSKYPEQQLLHIESDVLIMPNFPWDRFELIDKLAWLPVNSESDIAALLFLPNLEATLFFIDYLCEHARENPETTDMFALKSFAVNNPKKHYYLPSYHSETKSNIEQISKFNVVPTKIFDGIFDPIAYGIWNFGVDPKNLFGIRRRYFIDSSHFVDASKVRLLYTESKLMDSSGTELYNLHIHSKNISLFQKNWEVNLKKGLKETEKNSKSIHFSPRVLMHLIRVNGLVRTIWEIIANIPGIRQFEEYVIGKYLKNSVKKILKL
jgi:hypothetical protein